MNGSTSVHSSSVRSLGYLSRRVVTGRDENGRAIVSIDEISKNIVQGRPGAHAAVIWTSEGFPVDNDGSADTSGRKVGTTLDNGTVFRVVSFEALENRNIDAYVATGRAKDAVAGSVKGEATAATPAGSGEGAPTRVEAMRAKIKAGGHESPYRLRKQLPEPVFGQIKQARGFRQFLLRGFEKVRAEWAIVCTVHNLLKLN